MTRLDNVSWPLEEIGHAVDRLCELLRLGETQGALPHPPSTIEALNDWFDAVSHHRHVDLESVQTQHGQLLDLVHGAAPALFIQELGGRPVVLVLLRSTRRRCVLLGPDLQEHRLPPADVFTALVEQVEQPAASAVDKLLDQAGLAGRRRRRVRLHLLGNRLRNQLVGHCFLLRPSPGAPLRKLLAASKLPGRVARLLMWHVVATSLFLLSWWLIGRGALQGRVEPGWILAWLLALVTLIPVRAVAAWTQARISIDVGGLLRRRLLLGALHLEQDATRHEGVGSHLGRVLESNAVEELALGGGFLALVAAVELVLTGVVLSLGAGGVWLVALLIAWLGLTLALATRLYRSRAHWTRTRLALTHDLVEKMVGHRTRLAQQPRTEWYDDEDRSLSRSLHLAADMDRIHAQFRSWIPRGWTVVALATFLTFHLLVHASPGSLAVTLGGILFGSLAFQKLGLSLGQIAGAWISWQQVAHLSRAAEQLPAAPAVVPDHGVPSETQQQAPARILDVRNLSFRHANRRRDVLQDVSFTVTDGDHLLVEGPSGEGKSTLASLLVGLRQPRSGLLLSRGLDLPSLGPHRWRRRIVGVPQFHENHVLTGTLAFNLLLGRRWPPTADDLRLAESFCGELGLGDLLERMPAGLQQMVGETGWQLSHGEASRLFLARALLQDADLLILDETFAALDPENLQRCFECATRHCRALLVIAHP